MNVLCDSQRQFVIDIWKKGEQTQAQIAEMLGITQSNVSKILARARKRGVEIPKRRPFVERRPRPDVFQASQLGSRRQPLNMDYL